MNVPEWPWIVGGLFLLLMGIFLGVNLGRVGERARHGDSRKEAHDDRPRVTPKPKVDWGAINLDLSAPAKDQSADTHHNRHI
jgi:hypothetical protein